MNKSKANAIMKDVEAALQKVAETHQVSFRFKGGRFTDSVLTPRIEICDLGSDGEVVTPELSALRKVKPDWEGREFRIEGEAFKVIGWRARAPKRPILAKSLTTGKVYVFPKSALI